ncbi:MAG: hypothetical protein CM15mP120_28430 [Pseudomonadota bacterium]|nr:MAG: hypothetical protein CM15mP120_28430 [Pseudomonadota bacterium]
MTVNPCKWRVLQTAASEIRHLVDSRLPAPGGWSFYAENRKKLPKDVQPPALPQAFENKHLAEVISLSPRSLPITQVRPKIFGGRPQGLVPWLGWMTFCSNAWRNLAL